MIDIKNDFIAFVLSFFRLLRGLFDRLCWLKLDILKILITIVSGFIAFIFFVPPNTINLSYFLDFHNISFLFKGLGLVFFILSGIRFAMLLRTNLVFEKLPLINASYIKKNSATNEVIHSYREQAIVYSPSLNMAIQNGRNPIKLITKPFEVHPVIKKMLPLFILRMPDSQLDTFDSKKVRLVSDLSKDFIENSKVVNLQRTSYFRDRLSNSLANYTVYLDGRKFLELRTEVIENGNLISLRTSHLSNQLGGSVMLITKNGTITFLKQGNRTAENARLQSPAGSGSFDLLRKSTMESLTFQAYAIQQTKRELIEECGLSDSDIVSIQICGFGRYLYRNGKPEVFCIASTTRDSHSINPPILEWDYQQKVPMFESIIGRCNKDNTVIAFQSLKRKLDDRKFGNACGALYWNVMFAIEYLKNMSTENEANLFPWDNSS
jgi:hypothetical protein